jgi:hypothetical protein
MNPREPHTDDEHDDDDDELEDDDDEREDDEDEGDEDDDDEGDEDEDEAPETPRPPIYEALERLVERNSSDLTEEANRLIRQGLEREGLWPPPPPAQS